MHPKRTPANKLKIITLKKIVLRTITFRKWKNQNRGTGPVSLALIIVSVAVFLISAMGKNFDVIKPFLISTQESNFFKDILGGQIWRIITPIFLHFSILHIFFNMYWLYELGGQIEKGKV